MCARLNIQILLKVYLLSRRFLLKKTWVVPTKRWLEGNTASTNITIIIPFRIVDWQINPQWGYMGTTPDGKVTCACCGDGVIEIKCPYCHKNDSILNAMEDKIFFLKGEIHLDTNHAYYYQVQTQLLFEVAGLLRFCGVYLF